MSLSKNSEGGMGEAAFRAAACWDAAKLRNKTERQRGGQVHYRIISVAESQSLHFIHCAESKRLTLDR